MAGYMTFVIKYEDYAELQKEPVFETLFKWFKRGIA